MKKILTVILVAVLSLTVICGCNNNTEEEQNPTVDELLAMQYDDMLTSVNELNTADAVLGYISDWADENGVATAYEGNESIVLYNGATSGYENAESTSLHCAIDLNLLDTSLQQVAVLLYNATNCSAHGDVYTIFTIIEDSGHTGAYEVPQRYMNTDNFVSLKHCDKKPLIYTSTAATAQYKLSSYNNWTSPHYSNAYKITISGLVGGESFDYEGDHPNPITSIGDMLAKLKNNGNLFEIAAFNGGEYVHTYPTSASAIILVPDADIEKTEKNLDKTIEKFTDSHDNDNPNLVYEYEKINAPSRVLNDDSTDYLVSLLYTRLDDDDYNEDEDDIKVTSNIGYIRVSDSTTKIGVFYRGLDEAMLTEINGSVHMLAELSHFDATLQRTTELWTASSSGTTAQGEDSEYTVQGLFEEMQTAADSAYGKKLPEATSMVLTDCAIMSDRHGGLNSVTLGSNYNHWDNMLDILMEFEKNQNREQD